MTTAYVARRREMLQRRFILREKAEYIIEELNVRGVRCELFTTERKKLWFIRLLDERDRERQPEILLVVERLDRKYRFRKREGETG